MRCDQFQGVKNISSKTVNTINGLAIGRTGAGLQLDHKLTLRPWAVHPFGLSSYHPGDNPQRTSPAFTL